MLYIMLIPLPVSARVMRNSRRVQLCHSAAKGRENGVGSLRSVYPVANDYNVDGAKD